MIPPTDPDRLDTPPADAPAPPADDRPADLPDDPAEDLGDFA